MSGSLHRFAGKKKPAVIERELYAGLVTRSKQYMNWQEYERRKSLLIKQNLPHDQYEAAIRALLKELHL